MGDGDEERLGCSYPHDVNQKVSDLGHTVFSLGLSLVRAGNGEDEVLTHGVRFDLCQFFPQLGVLPLGSFESVGE